MYFPKSQVTTGLITNGSEFVIASTGETYEGSYWETSTGEYFTGQQPSAPNIQRLIKAPGDTALGQLTTTVQSDQATLVSGEAAYLSVKNITQTTVDIPQGTTIQPTEQDYMVGEFRRYFCQSINQSTYLEISQQTYLRLTRRDSTILWQYYTAFEMPWTLTGNREQVFRTNKNITELTAKRNNAINLAQFLKNDYLKYYKG